VFRFIYRVVLSDTQAILRIVRNKQVLVAYSLVFFLAVGVLTRVEPDLFPIVVAALVVVPMRFIVSMATRFEEDAYFAFSPVLTARSDHVVVGTLSLFSGIVLLHLVFGPVRWSDFGIVAFAIGTASVAVFAWSEALYERNFYFDRWHPVERGSLLGLGVLSILSPLFIPLFLFVHRVITEQFRYPSFGKFNETHSSLPHSMLFVLSGFVVAALVFEIEPFMITFLLLCAYAAHYVYPGAEKLRHGPVYYVRNNNPMFLFLNAYKSG